jgi:hypothetical protein
MKALTFVIFFLCSQYSYSQIKKEVKPTANIRLSFLIFPFTPLLTIEVRTIEKLTLQLETNFVDTHGANLKYFIKKRMDEHYFFTGIALVENELLRQDNQITSLPYAGYGYAYRFGGKRQWSFDNRIGIGATINADRNSIYPVIKTGIG